MHIARLRHTRRAEDARGGLGDRRRRRAPAITITALLLSVSMMVLAGCGPPGPAVRILFVGNSYTATNNLPDMVRRLAAAADRRVEVGIEAPGGWWWRDHVSSSETIDAIVGGDWDYVVLQEQSMAPAVGDMARDVSFPALRSLTTTSVAAGADVVLFLTWGHRNGSAEIGYRSFGAMQTAVADTYLAFADSLTVDVAPVGMAWWISLAERPEIGLYQLDGTHPSVAGSYLAAAVIAATILEVDATTLDDPLDLDEVTAEALREHAARAVGGEVPWEP